MSETGILEPTTVSVLLVEDNPGDADLIVELFPGLVTHVTRLSDAEVALRHADRFDAVLLDLRLPDADGVECVSTVRRLGETIPIVVLTGMEDSELALSCLHAGAQDYLSKGDVDASNLVRAVHYALARTREVSARHRADAIQARHAAIVEAMADAVVGCTHDGTITAWNRGAERIFGFTRDEAVGQTLHDTIGNGDVMADLGSESPVLRVTASGVDADAIELRRRRKDGRTVWVAAVASEFPDPELNETGLAIIYRDVTAARQREYELQERTSALVASERQLRALAARLLSVREEERKRIAQQVHDQLGQLLTGLKMDLRWVQRRLSAGTSSTVTERVEDAVQLVDLVVETVQQIATELRPSVLDTLGLPAAVRDEVRRFEARSSLRVFADVSDDVQPPPEIAIALFRVLQEALTNVARHAEATQASVSLQGDASSWILTVKDNGIGIKPRNEWMEQSLGLIGIRERAEAHDGLVSFHRGASGTGTIVSIMIPKGAEA